MMTPASKEADGEVLSVAIVRAAAGVVGEDAGTARSSFTRPDCIGAVTGLPAFQECILKSHIRVRHGYPLQNRFAPFGAGPTRFVSPGSNVACRHKKARHGR